MASNEDVLVRFKAIDQITKVVKGIGSSVRQMGIVGYQAITQLSSEFGAFGSECTEMAKKSETSWIAFNNSISKTGLTTQESMNQMKSEVVGMANELGVSTGSARDSFTQLNTKIGDSNLSLKAMESAQALASATGQDLSSTTGILVGALNGRGQALKKLGIDIEDYQDKTTKTIDSERLFKDITEKNKQALEQYGDSAVAVNQRLDNSLNSFEVRIGQSMTNLQSQTAPVITYLVDGISNIDKETNGVVSTVMGVGLSVVGSMGQMANFMITLTSMKDMYSTLSTAIKGTASAEGFLASVRERGIAVTLRETIANKTQAVAQKLNAVATGVITTAKQMYAIVTGEATILEYGFLAPILLIVGAIGLFIGALYLVGQYFGWWTDFPSFIDSVKNAILNLPQTLMNFVNILRNVPNIVGQFALNMLNGFVKWIKQIPQRVRQFFGKIPQMILSIGATAISSALNLGSSIFNSFKNGVGKITSWFSTELSNLPKAIGGAITGCADAIGNLGSSMWDAFKSALGIASPSMIYKRIMWDLEDMPNMIDKNRGGIVNSINTLGTSMITGYNQGLSSSKITGLSSYGVSSTGAYGGVSNTNNTATNIIIQEGAIQLDARNLTTKESKAIMINALEGLDSIESVNTTM